MQFFSAQVRPCNISLFIQRNELKIKGFFTDFISDGQRILSCGADHFMRVLDVHTGTEVYSKDVGEEIRCVAYVLFVQTLSLLKN